MKRLAQPAYIEPMQALNTGAIPTGTWLCEVKFDGYRAVAVLAGGRAELWSRSHKSLTREFPELAQALGAVRCAGAVLDGEVVALDERGRSRFQLLQNRAGGDRRHALVYYLFDIMELDGEDLTGLTLVERRRRLTRLLRRKSPQLQVSPAFRLEPAELFEAARAQGLEGIIAKRPESAYEAGRRSGAWVKCKVLAEQEFVVGGFTPPRRSREHFGAVLVGYFSGGRLLYAGKVGTGFDRKMLADLHAVFRRRARPACPFANLPLARRPHFGAGMTAAQMRAVTWLRPELVAQVRFAEWTNEGLLRQPVFLGLRKDKRAREVVRELGPVGASDRR